MALQKQNVSVNFKSGIDTKTDPFQLSIGDFVSISNCIFDKNLALIKRNGFGYLPALPDSSSSFLTTFNGNLTAIGNKFQALSTGSQKWINKGAFPSISLSILPLIRNNTNQSFVDTAIASNGLVCVAYTDNISNGNTTQPVLRYAISDSVTGQNIVAPTTIISSAGTASFASKVFTLGNNFIVVFPTFNGGNYHLQYISIGATGNNIASAPVDLTTTYGPSSLSSSSAFDGVVVNNALYLSWNQSASGGVRSNYLDQYLNLHTPVTYGSQSATVMSVTADTSGTTPIIWSTYYDIVSSTGHTFAVNQVLSSVASSSQFSSSGNILNIATTAQGMVNKIFYEISNSYSYGSTTATNFINTISVQTNGVNGSASTIARSVGLGSKAILIGSSSYFLSAYSSSYQPTYFLMNQSGAILAKLAYSNGGGYYNLGLPSLTVNGSQLQVGYLFKDLVQSVNKGTNLSAGTQIAGIYSQTGVQLATFNFSTSQLVTSETASNLHLNGGFLWMYDGYQPVEHNFFVWPDNVGLTTSSNGGSLAAQTYNYQATYEWADNQGNIFKSAPSIPVTAQVSGSNSSITINIPTLRLTYKTSNPVKIAVYRWSTAQPSYYQVTSINAPLTNSLTVDSVQFVDTQSDATILGNNLLYTTGGVVEDVNAPSANSLTLFDNRLWLIDSEDPNLLWYSKTVVEATPVEMSDLLTLFVPPTTSTQITTGPMRCLAPMDDKLIIFKANAIYYINGTGPDSTGANSQYSQPILITSTKGCINQASIVFTPMGLMFQSSEGIWLLGRDLSTSYIGAPMEIYNSATILSALTIPGTNQIRFTLNNGVTLLYDYYAQKWGTFGGIPAVSSTIYQNLHTYINSSGLTFQETPGLYLDGSNPTTMSFTTGWLNISGLQGYQRAYKMYLLGQYQTPHIFTIGVAYDYDPSIIQLAQISPINYSGPWGSDSSWGVSSPWGGSTQREQWQINFERQQCQSFQISFQEYFDPSYGTIAGSGLIISGMDLVIGVKKGFPGNIPAGQRTS